ncbi:ABC transporter substrate-binding protein [Segnochrobactrum spirostomi]|uniref:ABC transporter substrate-binding protein n=1 Tax=Segnochrobactrum spirostomi TaxID=2608987 RepID=A0A6A7Y205_9HYPH|nr:ABC transporter substrate-binding protein [Segnochrobactrum spirostomi]MQT11802.1 ABC transporter substrate-binding protein [Segnochrobactrum spirostomi]
MDERILKEGPRGLDRREFLTGTALLGALAGAGAGLSLASPAFAQSATPTTGGTLRLGMSGGATTDTLDPRTFTDWVPVNIAYQIMNGLVEIDADNKATPELLESWEPKPGAKDWVFNVRKGVEFHNGKSLDADDIIYSINLHRGDTKSAAKAVLEDIVDIKKLDTHQIQITLTDGNADLPYILSDYHLFAVPNGFTDWANPIGTGGYKLEKFEPGVRSITKKTGSYWKPNAGYVDSIEVIVINDITARINALLSNQVDIINRLDGRTVDLLKRNKKFQVIRSQAGQHGVLLMNCESDPYKNNDIRLALKYAIDREKIIKTVLNGYGTIGNDQPIPRTNPYYNADLPQHGYDPDKAKFHLKKAGQENLKVTLQVSEAAFTGATDTAVLFQAAAKDAGINLDVKREPSDGYWDNVWMKAPFCASYWGGRPTADQMLSIAYKSDAKWNDTNWHRPAFDKLLIEARAELDQAKRKELYGECQKMIWEDGGALIPMFIDYIEAGTTKVQGWKPHPMFDFMGQRIGEKVWMPS